MERFYKEIGMPITIKELLGRDITDEEIELMADKCSRGNTITVGTLERLGREEMVKIYKMAK